LFRVKKQPGQINQIMEMTKRETSFQDHLRQTPFTSDDRDLLTHAERWTLQYVTLPPVACYLTLFQGIPVHSVETISSVGDCISRAVALMHALDTRELSLRDHRLVEGAIHLYLIEAQRHLGCLFPGAHPFWDSFYTRVSAHVQSRTTDDRVQTKRRYAIFLLPVDALHALSQGKHQLEYELLVQSLGAIMTAVFGTIDQGDRHKYLHQALQLSNRIGLPVYDTWISNLLYNTKNIQS
jgi:hypothetical protein